MIAASIQLEVIHGDKQANLDQALERIAQCADCDLVILPELWNLGFVDYESYWPKSEHHDGPTLTALRQSAVKAGVYLHSGSFVEKDGDNLFNSAYLISPDGEILANYHKVHLFGHESQETALLTPGNNLTVVETPLAVFGLATCYDLRFPEMFRAMADKGAQVFLVCAAWPQTRLEHWLLFNRVRALENQCYLISANSTGSQLGQGYAGHSMMVDPAGRVIAEAKRVPDVIKAGIDPSGVQAARDVFPAFGDRVDWLRQ